MQSPGYMLTYSLVPMILQDNILYYLLHESADKDHRIRNSGLFCNYRLMYPYSHLHNFLRFLRGQNHT